MKFAFVIPVSITISALSACGTICKNANPEQSASKSSVMEPTIAMTVLEDNLSKNFDPVISDISRQNFIKVIARDLSQKRGQFQADSLSSFNYTVNDAIQRHDITTPIQPFTLDNTFIPACREIGGTPNICKKSFSGYSSISETRYCQTTVDGQNYDLASYSVDWPGAGIHIRPGVGFNGSDHPKEYYISFTSQKFGADIGEAIAARLGIDVAVYSSPSSASTDGNVIFSYDLDAYDYTTNAENCEGATCNYLLPEDLGGESTQVEIEGSSAYDEAFSEAYNEYSTGPSTGYSDGYTNNHDGSPNDDEGYLSLEDLENQEQCSVMFSSHN